MKKKREYTVRIKATVIKDVVVEAASEQEAEELAHGEFTVASEEGGQEKYEQETVSVL